MVNSTDSTPQAYVGLSTTVRCFVEKMKFWKICISGYIRIHILCYFIRKKRYVYLFYGNLIKIYLFNIYYYCINFTSTIVMFTRRVLKIFIELMIKWLADVFNFVCLCLMLLNRLCVNSIRPTIHCNLEHQNTIIILFFTAQLQ